MWSRRLAASLSAQSLLNSRLKPSSSFFAPCLPAGSCSAPPRLFRSFGSKPLKPIPVSHAASVASTTHSSDYVSVHSHSVTAPEKFWHDEAMKLRWFKTPSLEHCLTSTVPGIHHRWFDDGMCNITDQCLDFHVENGRGDQTALIWDSPATGSKKSYTYTELRDWVSKYAGLLRSQGVMKGDVVSI